MSATNDLQTGILARWAANAALVAAVPLTRVTFGSLSGSPTMPYVEGKIEKAAEHEYWSPATSGNPHFQHKRVTFTVRAASAADATDTIDKIATAFNAEFSVPNSTNFDWRLDDDSMTELPARSNAAQQVYEAKIVYLCQLLRNLP